MKNLFVSFLVPVVLSFSLMSCGSSGQSKKQDGSLRGEISVSGAFALYPLAVKWAEEFKKLHPEVKIDISAGGAGKGMTDVLANVVDLGMVSREVYPAEQEKGAIAFAVAKDAVVPTINAANPLLGELLKKGLSAEAATKLWISSEYKTWNQVAGTTGETAAHVYTRSDACGAAETWALWMGKKQEDLAGTAVFGDPGVATAIQKDVLGIGFNNIGYAYDETTRKPNPGLIIIPLDVNNNGLADPEELFYDTKDEVVSAIADGRFPSPPARELYLVTHGIPDKPEVIAFLKFILTEGQQYNLPAGYIGLSDEKLQRGLSLLEVKTE